MAGQEVQVRIRKLDGYLTPAAREAILLRLAALTIGRIKRRTNQGKDVEGKAFAPYSKRYAKQRRAAGRNATPVTLTLSGQMLNSMQVLRADATVALVGFTGSSAALRFARRSRASRGRGGTKVTHTFAEQNKQVSNALKALWNDKGTPDVPRRHFFGLSRLERVELTKDGLRQVIAAVRDASFGRLTAAGALRQARGAGR